MRLVAGLACVFAYFLAFGLQAGGQDLTIATSNGPYKMYVESHALLIGNSTYEDWSTLTAVPSDIATIKAELESQGFAVQIANNLTTDDLMGTLRNFLTAEYSSDTRLFIYYSGHGWSEPDGNVGYLVPVDSPSIGAADFRSTLVSMDEIRAVMERPRDAKHVLFVFDSCFAGTIFSTKALKQPSKAILNSIDKDARQLITSGSAGEEVPAESLFAPKLLDGITGSADLTEDGIVTGSELGFWLNAELTPTERLTPQWGALENYDEGDFVFLTSQENLPIPVDVAVLNRGGGNLVVPPKDVELKQVNSDPVLVLSGGPKAPCALQATQMCATPKFGGRLLPDTAAFVIDRYSAPVILEGGATDRSAISNVGWFVANNPVPQSRFCVRVYARTSACESEVSIGGYLSVFEEIDVSTPALPDVCFPSNPKTGEPETALSSRPCRPGELAFVQWHDQSEYPASSPQTGRWVWDRPNRALTFQHIDGNGDAIFSEQALVRVDERGHETWQLPGLAQWTELARRVVDGQTGIVLRRIDTSNYRTCKIGDKFDVIDAFVPLVAEGESISGKNVLFRWHSVECLDLLDIEDRPPSFSGVLGSMIKIEFDPEV